MKIVALQGSPNAVSRSASLLALAQSCLQGVASSSRVIATAHAGHGARRLGGPRRALVGQKH